jgi:hypothetical protein
LVVIPGEEDLAVCPGSLDRGEAGREVWRGHSGDAGRSARTAR